VPKYAISNIPVTNSKYLQFFIVSRNLRQNWALCSRPTQTINRCLAGWAANRIIAHEALCRCLSCMPGYMPHTPTDKHASMDIWRSDHRRPSVRLAVLPLPRLPPRLLLLYSGPVEMACQRTTHYGDCTALKMHYVYSVNFQYKSPKTTYDLYAGQRF